MPSSSRIRRRPTVGFASQGRLVVDVERRPVVAREVRERNAADEQPPRLDNGRVG
jgi:hypothetical protein